VKRCWKPPVFKSFHYS